MDNIEYADCIKRIEELEKQLDALLVIEKQNADLVAALKETYGWITTLDVNAFGVSYTDDKQRYSIRDKILDDIAKALAQVKGDQS